MELTVVVIATALLTGIAIAIGLNFVTAERQLRRPPPRWYDTRDPDFRQATGVLLGPSILSGNQVDVLVNGDEIFPAMLSAIRSAEQTITFETFIYWGEIAADFSA
ncbi:MAG TPA: hypothetical protein P5528_11800, partial [Steroidobacteraceae bacterium]|nr:hypothetical protein [Steroidobacteraceae bacterium]